MTIVQRDTWLGRGLGLALGLGIAAAAMAAWRVPSGHGVLGADVVFTSAPTGELDVDPAGPFLTASGLVPGGRREQGAVGVRNQTGVELSVRLSADPSGEGLNDALWVEARADGERFFRGPLGELQHARGSFTVASGGERLVTLEAWLPPGSEGFEGVLGEVAVGLVSEARGG